MADKNIYSTSIGVLKFSHKKAGYPDIKKIVDEWLKDPNFYQIIIRKVSKDDFGLQFIHFTKDKGDFDFMDKYINPYKDLIYAYDVAHQSGDKEDALDGILKNELIK
jgi:hypothetical protein